MKKYLNLAFITILFTIIFCSCNHNEPQDTQVFPIISELDTESKVIDWAALTSEERKQYPNLNRVVNSEDEFPQENLMDLEKIKSMNIDFDKYTLLLSYNKIAGIVEGHRYTWTKNLREGVFELWMDFRVNQVNTDFEGNNESDDEFDGSQSQEVFILTYYCTAVLVKKIPANSEVIFWR